MALTLPSSSSSNETFFLLRSSSSLNPNNNTHIDNSNNFTTHFNGGTLTQTTATLTPTRLKNIEETFALEQNGLFPPKPFLHQHMAGFVPPNVNISLHVKSSSLLNCSKENHHLNLNNIVETNKFSEFVDYYSGSNSTNSNDSLSCGGGGGRIGDGGSYTSSETNFSFVGASTLEKNSSSHSNISFTNNNNLQVKNNTNLEKSSKKMSGGGKRKSQKAAKKSGSSHSKKSTGGGRKPNNTEHLTPEEELKRAKRRERNKLAAARCRKRRVDQTNLLSDQTSRLERERTTLIEKLDHELIRFHKYLRAIESHESSSLLCRLQHSTRNKLRLSPSIYSCIDETAIEAAKEPVIELNDCDFSDFNDDDSIILPPKKKLRPNSLPLNGPPRKHSMKSEMVNQASNHSNPGSVTSMPVMPTPSNGIFSPLDFGAFESTGLTPLNPTVTDLTPSTMAAFVRTLTSPTMDDGENKKYILM